MDRKKFYSSELVSKLEAGQSWTMGSIPQSTLDAMTAAMRKLAQSTPAPKSFLEGGLVNIEEGILERVRRNLTF